MLCLSKYVFPLICHFWEEEMFGLFGGCFESLRLSQFHVTDGAQERRCGCKEKHDLTAAPPHTPQLAALFLGVGEKIVENFYLALEECRYCGKTVIGSREVKTCATLVVPGCQWAETNLLIKAK